MFLLGSTGVRRTRTCRMPFHTTVLQRRQRGQEMALVDLSSAMIGDSNHTRKQNGKEDIPLLEEGTAFGICVGPVIPFKEERGTRR